MSANDTPAVEPISPLGKTAEEARRARALRSPAYRQAREEAALGREVAWQLIRHRQTHGLTQQALAERLGTSAAQVSRLERGQQEMTTRTIRRIAAALGLRAVLTFAPLTPPDPVDPVDPTDPVDPATARPQVSGRH